MPPQQLSWHVGTPTFIDFRVNPGAKLVALTQSRGQPWLPYVSTKNNRKLILTTAGSSPSVWLHTGSGAFIRRWAPARARSRPAQRYVSAQVGEGDVTLGDTSVPELMQTDAFELMVHDPELPRARREPGIPGARRPAASDGRPDVATRRRSARSPRNPKAFAGVAMPRKTRRSGSEAHNANAR